MICSASVVGLLLFAFTMAAPPADVPTVEIVPGVLMPLINDGFSNRSLWIESGGRGLDPALSYGDADEMNVGASMRASGHCTGPGIQKK